MTILQLTKHLTVKITYFISQVNSKLVFILVKKVFETFNVLYTHSSIRLSISIRVCSSTNQIRFENKRVKNIQQNNEREYTLRAN